MWNRHEGKELHKYKYTYKDIADITGLNIKTIRQYVWLGKFEPKKLGSVVNFVVSRRGEHIPKPKK